LLRQSGNGTESKWDENGASSGREMHIKKFTEV
jgi:hypothetical protein